MSSYSEDDIKQISPREHVRLRPAMYIGYTDERATQTLVFQALGYAIDDAFLGACHEIEIVLHPDAEVSILAKGSELPTEFVTKADKRLLELVFTHPGIRKRYDEPGWYQYVGGLMGAGLFAVNSLSDSLTVNTTSENYWWRQSYREGVPTTKVEQLEAIAPDETKQNLIRFRPDFSVLQASEFDFEAIVKRCQEIAYLIAGLTITIRDERTESHIETRFQYEDGLKALVSDIGAPYEPMNEVISFRETTTVPRYPNDPVWIEFAFQFTDGSEPQEHAYVNATRLRRGGTHLNALKAAITSYINADQYDFCWQEISPGLVAAVSVRLSEPSFQSNGFEWLRNPELYGIVAGLVYEACEDYFGKDPHTLYRTQDKCEENRAKRTKDANNADLLPP